MAESLAFVGTDGSVVPLTTYSATSGNVFVTARRGFSAAPIELQTERLPNAPGTRYTGMVVRERVVAVSVQVVGDSWDDALDKGRETVNHLAQSGYFESSANGATRRLDVHYRGGLEGDSASRAGYWMPAVVEYLAPSPYWYDPVEQGGTIDMSAVASGVGFPITFPLFFPVAGESTQFSVTAGDVAGPWRATIVGPLTGTKLMRLDTNEVLNISGLALGAGQTLHLNTAPGQHRVQYDDGFALRRVPGNLIAPDSRFWQLKGGLNQLAVVVSGGATATVGFYWHNRYQAPG